MFYLSASTYPQIRIHNYFFSFFKNALKVKDEDILSIIIDNGAIRFTNYIISYLDTNIQWLS